MKITFPKTTTSTSTFKPATILKGKPKGGCSSCNKKR
jgi:hypothetical protein